MTLRGINDKKIPASYLETGIVLDFSLEFLLFFTSESQGKTTQN